MLEQFKHQLPDADPAETQDWIDSLDGLVAAHGVKRAQFILWKLLKRARMTGVGLPPVTTSRYINTIAPEFEPPYPGDEAVERRIRRLIRWNAAVMVIRANKRNPGLGGHMSTYASAATLYEVGLNHVFRGHRDGPGDHVFIQGHASPGIYARSFLEGRLTSADLDRFRLEASGPGLSSYPHPRLMPEYWEFPTVSMGLGPLQAVYQARFSRYLHHRGIADTSGSRVYYFAGDGEMDEPESTAGLALAAREELDNLTFVVNCNLQRLDGPVRGNGKIIQELEGLFRGAGWNVIKVVWGREWDDLLARDTEGVLLDKLNDTLDGDWSRFAAADGAYIRQHFFGTDPRLAALVAHLSDRDLGYLRRGGHDLRKVHAAYALAARSNGRPTAILAKTVKGWLLGKTAEGRNTSHQRKDLDEAELRAFRDRLELPIPDAALKDPPYFHPGPDSPEVRYLRERRAALGGPLPARTVVPKPIAPPPAAVFGEFDQGTAEGVEVSTTMAFVSMLRKMMKAPDIGRRIVPIVPDEARTFGMHSMFREFRIYSAVGQRYKPVDAETLMSYSESKDGQILQEGITEAGATASFIAAGTAYAWRREPMIPFYLFYSMFGFQRTADQLWSMGDARGRGFLLGCTAGRTTLNGEGLQHEDGHGHLIAHTNPACRAYDPAFAYEVAHIVQDGVRRIASGEDDTFYYLTLYNENYRQLPKPAGIDDGILAGAYRFVSAPEGPTQRVRLFASGPMVNEALKARTVLAERFDTGAAVYSVTSYSQLRREALLCERRNRLHPDAPPRVPYVHALTADADDPIVAVSDNITALPDLVARFVHGPYHVLGTDGFGRSDTRAALRRRFEIDADAIVVAALAALADAGRIPRARVAHAITALDVDADNVHPLAEIGL